MEKNELKAVLEALLFASADPLSPAELKKFLKVKAPEAQAPASPDAEETMDAPVTQESQAQIEDASPVSAEPEASSEDNALSQLLQRQNELDGELSTGEIRQVLDELVQEYAARVNCGFELIEVARGYQFRSKPRFSNYIRNMFKTPKPRFSAPSLESLSVVAYQQPVTKARLEEIRGVESGGVLKTLLERDLIKIVGRSEDPGRPVLYGTTRKFLEVFGLSSLSELPTLKDLASLETITVVSEEGGESLPDEEGEAGPIIAPDDGEEFVLTDEAADSLISELEDSMGHLKETEKRVFAQPEPKNPTDTTETP